MNISKKTFPPEVECVRAAWLASGMTRRAFADHLGVPPGRLGQVLEDGTYSHASLVQIYAALKLPAPPPKNAKVYPPAVWQMRDAWQASGLTQFKFAERAGVAYGAMICMLNNGTYSHAMMEKARAVLKLPPLPVAPAPPPPAQIVPAAAPRPRVEPATPVSMIPAWRRPAPKLEPDGEESVSVERHKAVLKNHLKSAQEQITEARLNLAMVNRESPLERHLTHALTLLTGVRFEINQQEGEA